ncbi:MAG: DUF2058 domain-containing protein [Candidatus Competibacteraceae bacterium]|nr:DUF2058 domain-containing protein [Candidatus Competibacteraceae bacterium]
MSSLREQLLKAGLVSEEQVKRSETGKRKQKYQGQKDRKLAQEEAAKRRAEKERLAQEEAAKRERDQALNKQRDAKQKRREELARIRQLLSKHRKNDPNAELPYNFQSGKVIRKVRVTAQQQKQLGAGRLGIVRNPQDEFDFALLPREIALKIGEIEQRALVVLYDEGAPDEEDDWGDWEWPREDSSTG